MKYLGCTLLLFLLFACNVPESTLDSLDDSQLKDPVVDEDVITYNLTLNGNQVVNLYRGQTFADQGASLKDSNGINRNSWITTTGANLVNTMNLVTDSQGYRQYTITYSYDSLSVSRTVRIYPDNKIPVITLIGNSSIEITVGQSYSEQGALVSDNLDSNLSVTVSGTVNTNQIGTYLRYYNAKDKDGNNAATVSRTIVVKAQANRNPTLDAIQDLSLEEGETKTIQIKATDLDNDSVTLGFIDDLPTFMDFIDNGDGTGELEINPQYGDAEDYALVAKAQDTKGGSDTEDFLVSVVGSSSTNDGVNLALNRPALASGFFSASYKAETVVDGVQDSTQSFGWWASAHGADQWVQVTLDTVSNISGVRLYLGKSTSDDPDGTTMNANFQVQMWINNQWQVINNITGNTSRIREFRYTSSVQSNKVRYFCPGTTFCRLREMEVYSGNFAVLPNNPPMADAGIEQEFSLPTNEVALYGSGTDSDGSIVSYKWSKLSGGSASFSNENAASTTVTNLVQGTYIFELKVTDDRGSVATDQVQVTVNPKIIFDPALLPHKVCDVNLCKKVVQPGTNVTITSTGLVGGDKVCLMAGTYTGTLSISGVKGSAAAPVTIMNCGGRVVINPTTTVGIRINNQSQYIKLTGTGDPQHKFGIKVNKTNSGIMGVAASGFSSDFEIEFLEVADSGFAGISAKTDPDCNQTTRPSFVQRNTVIHDNYIHGVGGEGLYIGYSFYLGHNNPNCSNGTIFPHKLEGVRIYNNYILNAGCEGIQVGSATADVQVYNNTVKNTGLSPFAAYQDNGVQIGAGSVGKWFKNKILNVPSSGFIVIGGSANDSNNPSVTYALPDGIEVYENIIAHQGSGVYVHNAVRGQVAISNNTIIDSQGAAAHIQNNDVQPLLKDNLMVHSGVLTAIYDSNASQLTGYSRWGLFSIDGNKVINSVSGQGFVDSPRDNYVLRNDSVNRTNYKGAQSSDIGAPIYMTP